MVRLITFMCVGISALALASEDRHARGRRQVKRLIPQPSTQSVRSYLNVAPMIAAVPSTGTLQARSNWTVVCDSEQLPNTCNSTLDGDANTFWRSGTAGWPHTLTVDMKAPVTISGVTMRPSNSTEGNVAVHEVYTSLNGRDWGQAVAYGTWWGDATEKTAVFEYKQARYVRLISRSAALGETFLNIANFDVYILPSARPQAFNPAKGRWGPTIDFPLVPAGGWVDPLSGRVITFSSYGHDRFDDRVNVSPDILGRTMTAIYDPTSKQVSQRIVNETGHDMFCPGMSFDATGRMVISGGRSNRRTSIYTSQTQSWTRYADLQAPRGYQSSATCSDGRIFTIGGSWDSVTSPCVPKNGEIYDPVADTWSWLPRALVKPMLTAEENNSNSCALFRSDNHAWLFSWKNNTVYQAGPSKATNWYSMIGSGGVSSAGNRSDDDDAMCGVAVMYDATQGEILTAGGSVYYANKPAKNRAFLATLDDSNLNSIVKFTPTGSMTYARIYHNAIVLPNGETFVTGGRTVGAIFADGTRSVLEPEMYSPTTGTWRLMARNTIPRNYHSFAVLLPDATVFSAGGGLCPKDCLVNHFDAQIFMPPYLYGSNGALLVRPVISRLSSSTVSPGAGLTIFTTGSINAASLIRYGSATHTVNTDQRRVPLFPIASDLNQYDVKIPTDTGVITPGYWMLFVMDAQGTPSVAATLLVALS